MAALSNEIPRIQAERALAMASAATYPHMGKDGARRWWDAMVRRTQRVVRGTAERARQLFTFGGKAVTPSQLKNRLASGLGAGFEG